MAKEIITTEDLNLFKVELVEEIRAMLKEPLNKKFKKYLRSQEVCDLLGISPGSLKNLRINRLLRYSKIKGTLFYKVEDVNHMMEKNIVK